jgi:hypothetical protein
MIKKLLLIAAAVAVPTGLLVGGGLAAAAPPAGVNATNATVTCTSLKGTATFTPPITSSEAAGTTKTTISATTVTGCTAAGVTVTISKGTASGSFSETHPAENGCSGLAGQLIVTGSLKVKWASTPTLSSGNSVATIKTVYGTIASDGHAEFEIPGPGGTPGTVTGSFEGTDHGATSTTTAETVKTAVSLLSTCSKSGLSSIALKSPATPPALHLG